MNGQSARRLLIILAVTFAVHLSKRVNYQQYTTIKHAQEHPILTSKQMTSIQITNEKQKNWKDIGSLLITSQFQFGLEQNNRRNIMYSSTKLLQRSQIYLVKKSKEPDHLLTLLTKLNPTSHAVNDQQERQRIRKKMLQKRIDSIMKNNTTKPTVSEPLPFLKKKWVSPLQQRNQNEAFMPGSKSAQQPQQRRRLAESEQVQHVVKVLDLNKRLKYFGEYLQVEYQSAQKVQVAHISEQESRMAFLMKRFQQLERNLKPKLCIFNYPLHEKVTFVNYLEHDEFFQNIMRKNDPQLVRMLIDTLVTNGSFTLTSYMRFYNIFVWQSADKKEQIDFVAKLLMKEANEKPLADISKVIDIVCRKIQLENFNKSLQNFNQVMKKLMFGDDYEYSSRKEYYLTRKALIQSLQINEECISIFINIFYST